MCIKLFGEHSAIGHSRIYFICINKEQFSLYEIPFDMNCQLRKPSRHLLLYILYVYTYTEFWKVEMYFVYIKFEACKFVN